MSTPVHGNAKNHSPQLGDNHQVQGKSQNPTELKISNLVQSERLASYFPAPPQINETHEQTNCEGCNCCHISANTCGHITNEYLELCNCKGLALGTCGSMWCYIALMTCQTCLSTLR